MAPLLHWQDAVIALTGFVTSLLMILVRRFVDRSSVTSIRLAVALSLGVSSFLTAVVAVWLDGLDFTTAFTRSFLMIGIVILVSVIWEVNRHER